MTKPRARDDASPGLFPAEQQPRQAAPTKEAKRAAKVVAPPKRQAVAVAKPKKGAGTAVSTEVVSAHGARPNLLLVFAKAASDPKCDTNKMEALERMVDKMKAEEAHVAFVEAFGDMQDELPIIDATGRIEIPAKEGSRSRRDQSTPYAKYPEIMKVVKPILKTHGFRLLILSEPGVNNVGVAVRAKLSRVHETQFGRAVHVETSVIAAPLETSGSKNNVQGVGSSLSYCKRYAVILILNIISHAKEDDDHDGHDPEKVARAQEKRAALNQAISKDQIKELRATMKDCGVGDDMITQKYKIERLEDLPVGHFGDAVVSCKNWKKAHE